MAGKPKPIPVGSKCGKRTVIRTWVADHKTMVELECECGEVTVKEGAAFRAGRVGSCRGKCTGDRMRLKEPDNYLRAHYHVYQTRGKARSYMCVCGCGERAEHWAYQYTDPHEKISKSGRYGSPEHYAPMTAKCHKKFDKAMR